MPTAIQLEDVSKCYRLGLIGSGTLREDVQRWWARLRGRPDPLAEIGRSRDNVDGEYIWALRNVCFSVAEGEVLGVIGKNGAGKSTLLKVLSRITAPTSGEIRLRGRVASLLEIGTGFHPELTGRENMYLNGAILGMKKDEVEAKFDEIVAFSGVAKFIDTPVKRYSSGMRVRLGFAVAAHLEPEILLVDEVLAVGDAEFQNKCIGKMSSVAREGRTVIFISHNMTSIRNLCERVIWLKGGRIHRDGDPILVTDEYLQESLHVESQEAIDALIDSLPPDPVFRVHSIAIQQGGQRRSVFVNGDPIEVEISYTVRKRVSGLRVGFDLLDENHEILVRSYHDADADAISITEPGDYVSTASLPASLLAPRRYRIRILAGIFNERSCLGSGLIIPLVVEHTSGINRGYPHDTLRSKLLPHIPWTTSEESVAERLS